MKYVELFLKVVACYSIGRLLLLTDLDVVAKGLIYLAVCWMVFMDEYFEGADEWQARD